jgi:hypothetical protein
MWDVLSSFLYFHKFFMRICTQLCTKLNFILYKNNLASKWLIRLVSVVSPYTHIFGNQLAERFRIALEKLAPLKNPKFLYCVHNCTPLDHNLIQFNPVHILTSWCSQLPSFITLSFSLCMLHKELSLKILKLILCCFLHYHATSLFHRSRYLFNVFISNTDRDEVSHPN